MLPVRVLFVDDEPAILLTLSAILGQKGFEVITAASVPEALKLINTEVFDVLISDLNIGEPGDGFTVVSAMRRVQPQTSTFILTGYPDFESALIAIRNQVDDYFTKPADINALIESIGKRLSTPKPPLRDLPLSHLSDVLQNHAQQICDQWIRAVNQNKDLAALALSNEERIGHIPSLLSELINRLRRSSEDTSEQATDAARGHGILRYQQGYSIPQIVLETRILQRTITSTIQANLLRVDVSTLVPDLVEIGESLATLLESSIRAYQLQSAGASSE
jgi:YesN/AraC family two-component response regulator